MRVLITLLLCAPLALATETIDGTNPPNAAKFGWNAATKTATMLVDVTESVVITGAGVTLDGDGHSITGAGAGAGIEVQKCINVTVKNCTVRTWIQGIRVSGTATAFATDAVIEGNIVEDCVVHGIAIQAFSQRAIIANNTVLRTLNAGNNQGMAIRSDMDDVQILGNTVHDNNFGIFVHGASRVLVKDNDADSNPGPSGSAATGVHLQNCTDCRVEDNSATGDGSSIKAESCTGTKIIGNTADTINVIRDDHSVIENNTVVAPLASAAITVSGGDNHVIRGNTANNRFNTSGFRAPGIRVSESSGTLIEGNTTHGNEENVVLNVVVSSVLRGNTVTGSTNGYGIKIQGSPDDLVVENNIVAGSESIGIYFTGGSNSVIRNNTVSGSGSAGIFVSSSSGIAVGANTCAGNTGGISVGGTGIVVHDNTVSASIGNGISVGGSGNTLQRNVVENGTVYGVYVAGPDHALSMNQIRNNAAAGIYEPNLSSAHSSGTTISENTLDGNGVGMFLRGATTIIEGNTVRTSGDYGIRMSGLSGEGTQNCVVRDNRIEDNTGDGLYLISQANLNTIVRNTVTGNGGIGIRLVSSQDNTIYDNVFRNTDNLAVAGGNTWSVAATAGPNIVGGPSIGGNFWATPAGDGFSETCTDGNGDGFCDQPFPIGTDNVDNLPLVLNTPPSCNPSGAGVYQLGSTIILGGTVADNEGDSVTWEWRRNGTGIASGVVQAPVGGAPVPIPDTVVDSADLGLGVHLFELVVDDGHVLDPVVCEALVEVVDTEPPTLGPESDCSMLWPPNHQMVTCTIQANASDNDGGAPILTASVTSSEADDGLGDGDTANDIQNLVVNSTAGVIRVDLRAERSGSGSGRIYTITITATDGENNSSTTSLTVLVPRSKGQGGN